MSLNKYLKDKITAISLNIISMIGLSLLLVNSHISIDTIFIILALWIVIIMFYYGLDYKKRKHYFEKLEKDLFSLEERYLISDIMKKPNQSDYREFYNILKVTNKSMLEKVGIVENDQKDYREFIEKWVHDIKTPITAIQLICENNKSKMTRKIKMQLEHIEYATEQVLYYARNEELEKNYYIKETSIYEIIHCAIAKCKERLIINKMNVEIIGEDQNVYTDKKWMVFILEQLINNAIQYRKGDGNIKFTVIHKENKIQLNIEDNGIGIPKEDLNRIFEKGFIGKNAQLNVKSTGIGLYLCKNLCVKLDLKIEVVSEVHKYTKFILSFPIDKTLLNLTK
ncbi:sensor histidine kinase [Haloimpatiens sp. FM7330]|uniref:sensor histidine kinase n=1 Tax=Haloimpatiens sp. FM7330 TaxID=3298610 RepID=UPI0036381781